ncbi:MAG: HlyD family efflux transporter periplasmic adaptor subunit [Bacteroidota bacterium]
MNKRKALLSFLMTFFLLLLGMGLYRSLSSQEEIAEKIEVQQVPQRQVRVRQLAPQVLENSIEIDGRLTAYKAVQLSANVSGMLKTSSPITKKGMLVNKGALLFDLDPTKAEYNLHSMRSSLLNAITLMIPDLKIDYPNAFEHWKNYLDDFEVEAPVKALPKVENKQEKYFVAVRNIYQLYYNIKSAEAQLEDYRIYAPFTGVLTQTNVFPGAMVMPGQLLASMINTSHFELEAPLREAQLAYVKPEQFVQLQSTDGSQSWLGKVVRIGQQIDPMTQSIPVYIQVKGKGLKEGMYLQGNIKGQPIANAIRLSQQSLVDQAYIFALKDSMVQKQQLTIIKQDRDSVYAQWPGTDLWIIQDDPRGLAEGQKVRPLFE